MIAKLTGQIDTLGEDHLIIDVNGVGYLVFASARTLRRFSAGASASLTIETHVREDHIHLYGFSDAAEKAWFGLLTTVQGVGAKVGLAILSALSTDELSMAIAAQDVTALCRAQGVGKKVGQRIATELKDKAAGLAITPTTSAAPSTASAASVSTPSDPAPAGGGATADAVSALVNLGYGRSDAFTAVGKAAKEAGADASLDTLIRLGLKELSA